MNRKTQNLFPSPAAMAAKRVFDVALATAALVLLFPLFAIAAAAVHLDSPGPVFFRQTRVGMGGRPFRIFKFRSMKVHDSKDAALVTVDGDDRVTRVGRFLRKTKLDELPQLFNVLRGEMSIIGPRPEVPEYVEKYPQESRAMVLAVRPGLSDFASIKFRDESKLLAARDDPMHYYEKTLLPAKLRYARFYVRRAGIMLDSLLIIWTLLAVLGWTPRQFRRGKTGTGGSGR